MAETKRSIPYNLNDRVAVTLTEKGRKILREHWAPYCRDGVNPADRVGEDGVYETQLWNLMSEFGQFIGAGLCVPFSTEIRLFPRDDDSLPSLLSQLTTAETERDRLREALNPARLRNTANFLRSIADRRLRWWEAAQAQMRREADYIESLAAPSTGGTPA